MFHMHRKKLGVVFGCLKMLKAMNRHTNTLRFSCRSMHKCMQFPTWSYILVLIPPFRHKQMATFFVMVHSDHQWCWTTAASLNIPSSKCMGHWGCHTVCISVFNHVSWSQWDWGLHMVPAETVAFKRCCWCWHTWNLWLQETETLSWICSRGKYIPWNAVFNTECISVSCQCRLDFIYYFYFLHSRPDPLKILGGKPKVYLSILPSLSQILFSGGEGQVERISEFFFFLLLFYIGV